VNGLVLVCAFTVAKSLMSGRSVAVTVPNWFVTFPFASNWTILKSSSTNGNRFLKWSCSPADGKYGS
jgi:hypothetical protein